MEDIFTSKKKLGFGLMRLPLLDPNDAGSIDLETTKKWWMYLWNEALHTTTRPGCIATSKAKKPPKKSW